MQSSAMSLRGTITWELRDAYGVVLRRGYADNLITRIGDQLYAERGSGITTLPIPTGMKLGTGSVVASKTGTGAALTTYLANSHQAFDGGFPSSTLSGPSRRITYQVTWAAGKATSVAAITEVVIINEALTDATSAAPATISRALLSGVGSKSAAQTLSITWTHDLLGA